MPGRGAQPPHHHLQLPAQQLDGPAGEAVARRPGCRLTAGPRFQRGDIQPESLTGLRIRIQQ